MYFKRWEDDAITFYNAKYEREIEESKRKDEERNEKGKECLIEGGCQRSQGAEKKKREKIEKEKMRRDIEKSQIARETRCGINFTGKEYLILAIAFQLSFASLMQ